MTVSTLRNKNCKNFKSKFQRILKIFVQLIYSVIIQGYVFGIHEVNVNNDKYMVSLFRAGTLLYFLYFLFKFPLGNQSQYFVIGRNMCNIIETIQSNNIMIRNIVYQQQYFP